MLLFENTGAEIFPLFFKVVSHNLDKELSNFECSNN